jgi:hypothetical protein
MSQAQDGAAPETGSKMRLTTITLIVTTAGVIGGIVFGAMTAIANTGGVLFVVYKDYEAAQQKRILEFQQAKVSAMIADHGQDGVKVSELQDEYDYEARRAKLPQAKLGDDQLDLIVLNLVEKHAIIRVGADRVRMLSESDLCGSHHTAYDVYNQRSPKALDLLSKYNGRLTVEQTHQLFRERFELKDGEEQSLFGDLFSSQRIGIHQRTQKVWNLLTRSDMKPECFPPQPLVIVQQRQAPIETTYAPSPASSTPRPAAEPYASTLPPADVFQGVFQPPQRYRRVAARPTEATPAWIRE